MDDFLSEEDIIAVHTCTHTLSHTHTFTHTLTEDGVALMGEVQSVLENIDAC